MAAAKADMDALASGRAGRFRVGTFQTVGAKILPEALRRVLSERPGLSIELTEEIADPELLSMLEQRSLDLAFAVLPLPPETFEWVELFADPFVALVEARSPLAQRGHVSIEELAERPLICFRSCRVTQMTLDRLRAEGREPDVVFCSDQNETLQGAAAAGLGAALLPELAVDERDQRLRRVRIVPEIGPRVIAAVWRADEDLAPAAAALVDAARDVCRDLAVRARPAGLPVPAETRRGVGR
jgi:LysR family hydrogen peroxide-inducible transcriptional activator